MQAGSSRTSAPTSCRCTVKEADPAAVRHHDRL